MVEQNSENIVYPYDSYGLFLGLISYPFNKDGKEIYKDLEIFFKEHKSRLAEYDPSPSIKLEEFDKYLYKPAGYRIFGSQGLAVLSLVDDYAFPIRYFDKDHIQALVENEKKKGGTNPSMYYENFHSVVVMGVNEWEKGRVKNGEKEAKEEIVGEEKSLVKMAENTFLNHDGKTKCKYPFIGIIRLKINSQKFLLGKDKGIATIRKIRKKIDSLEKDILEKEAVGEAITVECFDNDEMTVLAFSDNLLCLFNFLGEIRSMKNEDLEGLGSEQEKHVFGSTLISFGYDVAVDLNNVKDKLEGFSMKCMIETKCGHRDSLYAYFKDKCELYTDDEKNEIGKYLVKNMTGGCNIIATMPLERISELEKCCLTDNVFKRDIRRMKVVLEDLNPDQDRNRLPNMPGENHAEAGDDRNGVNERDNELPEEGSHTNKMKKLMKKIGISKMVRDRMLSLYELYDNAHENLLQQIYLEELKDTLKNFYAYLEEMHDGGYSIGEIEKTLNVEIENMESAIYDRLHVQKHNQVPLEYTGGIQQYLTSFNYAYNKIYGYFNDKNAYVSITGAERGSSVANMFMLNINEILYPELFITLIWKEIANFALLCNDNPKGGNVSQLYQNGDMDNKKEIELIDVWRNLTTKDAGYDTVLINSILLSPDVLDHDLTSQIIVELLTKKDDHELLKYFLKDYLVLHFAFDDDFKMMWHFYFKTLMQTAVSYESLNRMKRRDFIHMLLRLFIVALVRGDNERVLMNSPFDSLISNLWMDHFDRTWKIAQVIYRTLEQFGFKSMLNLQIKYINLRMMMSMNMMDTPVVNTDSTSEQQDNSCNSGKSPNVDDEIIAYMKQEISKMSDDIIKKIEKEEMVVDKDNPIFICSLFQAYMRLIYDMDLKGEKIIKCLPRDENGEIASFIKCTDSSPSQFYDNAIALIVDPAGGVFVSSAENRKKYFLYRTLLYRSLWNYRYTDVSPTNKNVAK